MSNFGELKKATLVSQNRRTIHTALNVGSSNPLIPCVIGRNGQTILKKEGDEKTPIGIYHPQMVYYRQDRTKRPQTALPVKAIKPSDGWCDEQTDRNYNRPVTLPYKASAENLWREDALYDLIIVTDHNQCPRIKGRGSAIFIHVAKQKDKPTQGCIALEKKNLYFLLRLLDQQTKIIIS